ncbi:fatty acid desaturase family protein [Agrobacterium rhizogenes]|uniref:guanitoxin biosynthesis L-arginine gamma (S) hydroxylase n=1 Tax=Rhizobium rhizogenes TaxID=359 RepID=UPI00157268A9|nr:guanitoxin biosynthesis L-arginine gamma (S) hydroxylase [Rhizobium rhizogenes]NTG47941.1 fatty acid desaturase family protein [Rhizobium rhizogenes]
MEKEAKETLNKFRFSSAIKADLKLLYANNDWHWLLGWTADILVIAIAVGLFKLSPYAYPLTILLIGSRQRAFASLLHEAAHMTLARNRRLSRFIGQYLTGLPVFQDFDSYHHSHVKMHHHYLGDPHKDPDYIYYIESGLQRAEDRFEFVFKHLLKTVFLLKVISYLNYLIRHRLAALLGSPIGAIKLLSVHAVIFAIFFAAAGPSGYVLFWLIPYLTTFQIIGWLSEVSEHFGLLGKEDDELLVTRNRFPAWWERAFIGMHGDNLHLTHHLLPGIPYWNLQKAHRILMRDERYAVANGQTGGIISRGKYPRSVMRQILDGYRAQRPTAHSAVRSAA